MIQTIFSSQVTCRPASERDYKDIVEFCKGIWDGEDYVPEVWHEWLEDSNGILVTAEYNDHAIGCAKLSLLAKGQWWLEGFRVDPKYQGLKVGSHIHNYITDWWKENCDGTIRLMTSSKNLHVHHLCKKTSYIKTHEVCGFEASPIDEEINQFSPAVEISEMASFSMQAKTLTLTAQHVDLGWRICKLDEQIIEEYSCGKADFSHTFHWWKQKKGLFSFWVDENEDKKRLGIGVLACELEDIPAFLKDIRRFAAGKKFDEVFHIIFELPQIISQVEAAGFMKRWEHNAFIFERRHPTHP